MQLHRLTLGHLADDVGQPLARGRELEDVVLAQLEDRRPDTGDDRVEIVHVAAHACRHVGIRGLQRPADPVQGQPDGEDALDDVVVQVTGDALAVGLELAQAPSLLLAGEVEQPGAAGGAGDHELGVARIERGRAGDPEHREQSPAGQLAERDEHGRPVALGELDDDGRPPPDDRQHRDVLEHPEGAGGIRLAQLRPRQGDPDPFDVLGARPLGDRDGEVGRTVPVGGEDDGDVRVGHLPHGAGQPAQGFLGVQARQQVVREPGRDLCPAPHSVALGRQPGAGRGHGPTVEVPPGCGNSFCGGGTQ